MGDNSGDKSDRQDRTGQDRKNEGSKTSIGEVGYD